MRQNKSYLDTRIETFLDRKTKKFPDLVNDESSLDDKISTRSKAFSKSFPTFSMPKLT